MVKNARELYGVIRGDAVNASVTANQLLRLRDQLSERDWQIIWTLARVRVATTTQLEQLHFGGVTRRRAQRRLAVLVSLRVLGRLPRVIGGARAGSSGHVYGLDVAGQRLVDLNRGRRPRRPRPVGSAHLDHSLAITEVFVDLMAAERAGQLAVVQFVGGSAAWRSFHGHGGARAILKPDAYVVTQIDGYEDHWFLEMDLGTQHLPALARRLALYRGYWQSGTEQAQHDVFPRVLWLVPDQHRTDMVASVIARQPAEARSLFVVSLRGDVVARMRQGAGP
jgi:hypothetical protein